MDCYGTTPERRELRRRITALAWQRKSGREYAVILAQTAGMKNGADRSALQIPKFSLSMVGRVGAAIPIPICGKMSN